MPKITVRLITILNSFSALRELATAPLPIRVAYKLSRDIRAIEEEVRMYQVQRTKIDKKYLDAHSAKEIEDIANVPEYVKDVTDLFNVQIDLDLGRVKLEDFVDSKDIVIKTSDLMQLDWYFEQDKGKAPK